MKKRYLFTLIFDSIRQSSSCIFMLYYNTTIPTSQFCRFLLNIYNKAIQFCAITLPCICDLAKTFRGPVAVVQSIFCNQGQSF